MKNILLGSTLCLLGPVIVFTDSRAQDLTPISIVRIDSAGTDAAPHGANAGVSSTFKNLFPAQHLPVSVESVDADRMLSQGHRVLGDALRYLPGLQAHSIFGESELPISRGFDALRNGRMLVDGASDPALTFFDLYNVQQIELLKGPGSFLYGGQALVGTINLVPKQPLFDNFLNVAGSFGQFTTVRGRADVGLAHAPTRTAARLNAVWHTSEQYRELETSRRYAFNPMLTWQPNARFAVTASYEYVRNDDQPDAGVPLQLDFNADSTDLVTRLPDVPRTRSYQSPFDDSDQQIYRLRLDAEYRALEDVALHYKAYFTDFAWLSTRTLIFSAVPDFFGEAFLVGRSLLTIDDHEKVFGNQLEARATFRTGVLNHTLLVGTEINRTSADLALTVASLPSMDLMNPEETATELDRILRIPVATSNTRRWAVAPYILEQARLGDAWTLLLGGRLDVIDFEGQQTEQQRPPQDVTDNYEQFSPIGGLVFTPSPRWSLYASRSEGFVPPSRLGRREAEPEESQQWEIGTRVRWPARAQASLAFFHLNVDRIGVPDLSGVSQQTGQQRSRGLEVELLAEPLPDWHWWLGYAFTEAELLEHRDSFEIPGQDTLVAERSGNRPPFAPRHLLNAWTRKEFKNGLGLGLGLRYVSRHFIDEDNDFEVDPYVVLDGLVYYRFRGWRLSVNLENLTDTDYVTRGFGPFTVMPAAPFAAYAAVHFGL